MNAMYMSREIPLKGIMRLKKNIRRKRNIGMIVVSKNLKSNPEFMNNIKALEIPIVDGRWLFKFLVIHIIEYISNCQDNSIRELKIAFTIDSYNSLVLYYIKKLARSVKSLMIITNQKWRYEDIQDELFNEDGTVLIVANNKRKSLKNIDIVINFDFDHDRLNSFIINDDAIIVNLKERIDIVAKRFRGININYYEISFKNRVFEMLEWIKYFQDNDVYESYLYQNTSIENIMSIINNDKIRIKSLIGNNGKIPEKEYKIILDKNTKLA